MRSNLVTFLILALYLFLPPVICVGENNHIEVETRLSHSSEADNEHPLVEFAVPHAHHHHGACVDVPLPAETQAKSSIQKIDFQLADGIAEPSSGTEISFTQTSTSPFTASLLRHLRATILIV